MPTSSGGRNQPHLRGAGGGSRSGLLDCVRLFASLDIVAFHTGNALSDPSVFRFGLGMGIFLLMTGVSVGAFVGERPFLPLVRERATRYLPPFLFWCVVYAALRVALAVRHEVPLFGWLEADMLWRGTYYHLWFMPVALGLSLLVEALRRATRGVSTSAILATTLLGSPLLLYAAPGWLRPAAGTSLGGWLWVIPAVPMGVALGRLFRLPKDRRSLRLTLGFVATFAAVGIAVWYRVDDNYPLRFAVGACLIGVALAVPFPSTPLLFRMRTLSVGVFLCHPLVLRLLGRFFDDLPTTLVALIIWVLSACLTLAMQATPLARFAGAPPASRDPDVAA